MDLKELEREVQWVLRNYGSDAGEQAEPGSMAKARAERIVEFVAQVKQAEAFLEEHNLHLVRIARIEW